MKYVIQSCSSRLWYVQNFLVPDMLSQGIKESDICVLNDDDSLGCLWHYIRTCEIVLRKYPNEPGVWRLQDDVLISSTFKEATEAAPKDIVCNGYLATEESDDYDKVGLVAVKDYWYSFPCIYVPNEITRGFLEWFKYKVVREGKHSKQLQKRKYDDYFFWLSMQAQRKDALILNMYPNIIQHVDYLLNGSVVNQKRKAGKAKAYYWLETEREEELAQRIAKWKNNRDMEQIQ